MVMRVTIDDEYWLADVGFGAAVMSAPLKMSVFDEQVTHNGVFRLSPVGDDLKLAIRSPNRWIPMVLITPQPQLDVDFIAPNWFTSTHPNSMFRNRLVACRATAEVRYSLMDNRFTIRKPDGSFQERELNREELEATMEEIFDIEVTDDLRGAIERVVWSRHSA